MKRFICTVLLLATAGITHAENWMINPNVEDDDKPWEEQKAMIPDYPVEPEWLEFQVGNTYKNKAFIDAKTASIGKDAAVRVILRIVSPSGAENISYEGLRCRNRQISIYAYGDTYNKRWIAATRRDWRIIPTDDQMHRRLVRLICEDATPASDEALVQLFRNDSLQKMPDRGRKN